MNKRFFPEKKELTATLVNLAVVKMFFTYPRVMVMISGNAAWLQMIYVTLLSFFIFCIIQKIMKNVEQQSIFEMAEKIGGAPLRIVTGVVLIGVLTLLLSSEIRVFSESVGMVLLPNTSTRIIMLLFLLAIIVGAYVGINSICRVHSLVMPLIAIVLMLFFVVLIPYADLNNITPIFGKGTQNIFLRGAESIYIFADLMTIYIIMPLCKNKDDAAKSTKYAFLIGGLISTLLILIYTLVYPFPESESFVIPSYQLARMASVGSYFQRFEAFFEFAWSISMLLYAAYHLYVICYAFSETFKIKFYKELLLPVALLAASIGFMSGDILTFLENKYIISRIVYPVLYIVPVVIGILFNIKRKRGLR